MGHCALLEGYTVHKRPTPFIHQFRYGYFSLLLDLDELEALHQQSHIFSVNRFNLFSWDACEHGWRDGSSVKTWAVEHAKRLYGLNIDKVLVCCYPKFLGFVFNPISVYFLYDASHILRAVIYEVANAYKQRHCYIAPIDDLTTPIKHRFPKEFYVSPYIPVMGEYQMQLYPPTDAGLELSITLSDPQQKAVFFAMQKLDKQPWSDAAFIKLGLKYFFLSHKVWWRILKQALYLMRRGLVFKKPPPPPHQQLTMAICP
jgi:uncharacterized protein